MSNSIKNLLPTTDSRQLKTIWKPANLVKIFVVLSIAFICGAFFFIRSENFLDWVEGRLEVELTNRITKEHTAHVGEIRGNILGSVTVSSIAISKKDAPDQPIISTGKVTLKYNLLGLLTRRFEVKKLQVSRPQIHAVRNPDGSLNLAHIFKQGTPQDSSPFGFAIGSVISGGGTIAYVDPQQNLRIAIRGVSISVQGMLNTWDHKGTVSIDAGSFTFNGAETPIDNFNAKFVLLANGSRLDNLQLAFGNSDLTVKGGFEQGTRGTAWDGILNLKLDVSDVQRFFGEELELEGVMTAKLEAEGTDATLDVKTLSVNMPTFSMVEVPVADSVRVAGNREKIALAELTVDANFKYLPTPTFTLTTFSAQVADGNLTGEGKVALENEPEGSLLTQLQQLTQHPLTYEGQWRATEIQLGPFLSMFVQSLPENLSDSTGCLSGTAQFSGNSTDLSSFTLDSEIALIETTLDEVALEDSTLTCRIESGVLNANGNLDETEIDIKAPFPLRQQDTFDIRASGINFDKVMKIVNSANFGGIGTVSATLSSDGVLKGFLEMPDATFNDIPMGVLAGNFRYQEGRVYIENGLLTKNTKNDVLTQYESRTTINGTVDIFKDEFPTAFSIVADPVYVQHYPKLLLGAEYPVDGEIRGELKLDGTLINLDGSANFSVTKGVAWGIHLDAFMLPLEIEDYNLNVSNFKITTRGQQVTMNVAVAANGDYDLRLESDAPVRFEEIAKAANISDFPFEGQFDVRVVGILEKPASADFRVELDFSDITYLPGSRGTKHLLGDAYLLGKLVARENTSDEPDIFDFQGHGFEGTSRIRGYVSMAVGNPYRFVVASEGIDVAPFLRILHPTLETVTGTGDGHAAISGTIADLAPSPTSTEPRKEMVYPYDVDIRIDTSQLRYGNPTGQGMPFTNTEPIRLHLRDDKWTIDTLSLRTLKDASPFFQLTGTFDAKTEAMDFQGGADGFALAPFGPALGVPDDIVQAGTGRYTMHITGTSKLPVLALEWSIPTLTLKTEVSDVYISDAGGAIAYQDEVLRLEGCAFKFFSNDVSVEGSIDIQPEDVDNSELHLRVDTIALDLVTLPMEISDGSGSDREITGVLEASMEIGGTLAEPHVLLYAETAVERSIYFPSYIPSITLERLRVDIGFGSESIRIETAEATGQMGAGTYRAQGEAEFSRRDTDAMRFAIDVSASQVEIADYGVASGYIKLTGTGLDPDEITVVGEINELVIDGYDFHLINSAPILFRSDPKATSDAEMLAMHLPLQITSPAMTVSMSIGVGGTLNAPNITAKWDGTLNQKDWKGDVQYNDEQIRFVEVSLKDGTDTLTLTGVVPFNMAFAAMDISERKSPSKPIDLHLRGSELPIDFFLPSPVMGGDTDVDVLFSEADGTVDIDLALQGTSRSPYIVGTVFLEALQLALKDFHEPIRNLKVQLDASEDRIDVTDFQFEIGSGYCRLQQGQLVLNGLMPKRFTLAGLRFERFPLGSAVREALPPEIIEEVEGHLSATLRELIVPLDSFFTNGAAIPFPQIQKVPSLKDLVAVSSASLSINSVRLAFKALDRHYDFQDPQPVPILLSDGVVVLSRKFSLENQDTFLIKQTFSGEDTKPEGLLGEDRTISGRTTFSIDEGSSWRTDGEFDMAARIANFDVSAITDAWPLSHRVTGALSGTLQLSGTSENPKITIRRHTSDPAELYLHDVPIDLRWRIRYQNGKWEISKKRYVEVTFGENRLTFSWMMPYQLELIPFLRRIQQVPETVWREFQQIPMDGILDIEVTDLDMLPFVVPGLGSPTGTGEVHVELTGTIEAPQAIGSVFFSNMGFEFPDAGITVKGTEGKLQLSEKGINITELDGGLNGGDFSIRGSITAPPDRRIWQTPPTLELSASIAEVVLEQSETYLANLDFADLRLHGDLLHPYLTGDLNINGGYYQQNWEILRDWLTGVSINEADVVLDYPIVRDLHLDVAINIPGNFRVLSSITGPTDIEIACLGKLIGPINQPVFSGDVSVRRGKVGFIIQPFEIIEGSTISNRDTFNFNPDLNIFLRTPERIRGVLPRDESIVDIQVHAAITGTLSNPNFVLSAPTALTTEVLTHEDIIAFLSRNTTFSRTFGEFTFSVQRPLEEEARSIIAEYPLTENMSIKVETNERGEHGVDFELKGRF